MMKLCSTIGKTQDWSLEPAFNHAPQCFHLQYGNADGEMKQCMYNTSYAWGEAHKMTKSSPCLKASMDLLFPFINEGTKPTGQGQTISPGAEGLDQNTGHLTLYVMSFCLTRTAQRGMPLRHYHCEELLPLPASGQKGRAWASEVPRLMACLTPFPSMQLECDTLRVPRWEGWEAVLQITLPLKTDFG